MKSKTKSKKTKNSVQEDQERFEQLERHFQAHATRLCRIEDYIHLESRRDWLRSNRIEPIATSNLAHAATATELARQAAARHQHHNAKFIRETQIVGGFYHQMLDAVEQGLLHPGAWLNLHREYSNPHHSNAIACMHQGMMIGYLERSVADLYAPFMDAGCKLAVKVHRFIADPRRLDVRLYVKKQGM